MKKVSSLNCSASEIRKSMSDKNYTGITSAPLAHNVETPLHIGHVIVLNEPSVFNLPFHILSLICLVLKMYEYTQH